MFLKGLGFLTFLRFFVVRVYIRVSYGCVEFRLFGGLEDFGTKGWLRSLTVGKGLVFFTVLSLFAIRVYLRVSYGV